MDRAALAHRYARAQYRVRLPRGGHATIHVGRPLPPSLMDTLPQPNTPWAFATAWNPRSETLPARANRARQHQLLAALQAQGATLRAGVSMADGGAWHEPSLFVTGLAFACLDHLMRPFDQHAIVRGTGTLPAELHWLDQNGGQSAVSRPKRD